MDQTAPHTITHLAKCPNCDTDITVNVVALSDAYLDRKIEQAQTEMLEGLLEGLNNAKPCC